MQREGDGGGRRRQTRKEGRADTYTVDSRLVLQNAGCSRGGQACHEVDIGTKWTKLHGKQCTLPERGHRLTVVTRHCQEIVAAKRMGFIFFIFF